MSGFGRQFAAGIFQSVRSRNDTFVKMWADFNEQLDKITNYPWTLFIGSAVAQA